MALPGLGCGGLFSCRHPYRGRERNGCRESDERERCGCRVSGERERCGCRESDERQRCGSLGYCSGCKLLYFLMQVGGRLAVGANLPFFEANFLGGLGVRFALCLAPFPGRSLLLAEVCAPSALPHKTLKVLWLDSPWGLRTPCPPPLCMCVCHQSPAPLLGLAQQSHLCAKRQMRVRRALKAQLSADAST